VRATSTWDFAGLRVAHRLLTAADMRLSSTFLFLFASSIAACSASEGSPTQTPAPGNTTPAPDPEPFRDETLPKFGSQAELETYLEKVAEAESTKGGGSSSSGGSPSSGAAEDGAGSSAPPAAPSNDNITNNQESGVDEGGIVKNIGDHLVVLRKGRLYAVSVANGGALSQTSTMAVAPTTELNNGVWYDEMLVKGDKIYVIGYRYKIDSTDKTSDSWYFGATEVSSFRLTNGNIERLKTLYIESSDYFSGRNYASRLVDGKLVFYMPHYAWQYTYPTSGTGTPTRTLHFPRFFSSNPNGTFTPKGDIFSATDVYVPVALPDAAIFHTVTKCELPDDGDFACESKSVLAGWSREFYVTNGTVFLWTLPHVYGFRFKDLGALAHTAAVSPRDQFSFKLHEGTLHVVGQEWTAPQPQATVGSSTSSSSSGGTSTTAQPSSPAVRLVSIPLQDFDTKGAQALKPLERDVFVPASGEYASIDHNRFVGDKLVASLYRYGSTGATKTALVRFDAKTGANVSQDWDGYVSRIEPLGDTRAIVATAVRDPNSYDEGKLALDVFDVSGGAAVGHVDLEGMSEGESRSHGFFYKPDANAFGLPVVSPGGTRPNQWYARGLSNIAFFDVASTGAISPLGAVASSGVEGTCEVSCVDWYGNTRPIFLKGRTFALMGGEIREVTLRPNVQTVGGSLELTK
jgi:hypothetical protein